MNFIYNKPSKNFEVHFLMKKKFLLENDQYLGQDKILFFQNLSSQTSFSK